MCRLSSECTPKFSVATPNHLIFAVIEENDGSNEENCVTIEPNDGDNEVNCAIVEQNDSDNEANCTVIEQHDDSKGLNLRICRGCVK